MIIEFELQGLPKSTNARMNWRVRARVMAEWRLRAKLAALQCERPAMPFQTANLTLTRCSSMEPDFDNLVTSMKPVIDGLKDAGVIIDDKRANVGQPEYLWEKAKQKCGKIKVRVEGF